MGIAGLLNTTVGLLSGFTNFGLDVSAVKSIASINAEEATIKLSKEISVLNRLIWITGIVGTLVTLVFSGWLSKITFGNNDYRNAFIWLSIVLLFKQLANGHLAVLQGLRKLKFLAQANLFGNLFGLLITIPFYYYWKIDAIVPAIIISSVVSLFFTWFYYNKNNIKTIILTNAEVFSEGKSLLKLGVSLSIISLITLISGYILQVYIGNTKGVGEVGLFSAGFLIINNYVGLVFNAMGTDYYPRLSAINQDNDKIRVAVLQQALIAVLIITPIIVLFITFAPFIIKVLYSSKFSPIISMVNFGILGMLFKAVSWSMGYILIAKGDSKLFIKTSISFNSLFLMINIMGYYFYGLQGLGVTFTLNFMIHFFSLKIITFKKYDFYFDKAFYKTFLFCIFLCVFTFLFSHIKFPVLKYGLMSIVIVISTLFTVYELNKKIDFKSIIIKLKNRK